MDILFIFFPQNFVFMFKSLTQNFYILFSIV